MKMIFKSDFFRSGLLLRPYILEICNENLHAKRRNKNLVTSNEIIIPLNKIAGVKIYHHLIGTDIIIYGNSAKTLIVLIGFSFKSAKAIKKLIT